MGVGSADWIPVTLRYGVLGAGWVATARHLPCLARDERVEIAAVFDPTRSKAARAVPEGALATDDLDQFFEDDA